MNTNRSVRVKDIVEKFQMEVINRGTDYDTEILTITDVNRPGLQFIGFFDYFDPRRLQIIGKSEVTFLRGYSSEERRKRFEDLFCYDIPALVISRDLDVFPECLEMAQKHGRTLLRTGHTSVEFTAMTIDYLNHQPVQGIKLQLLHVLKGTDLADDYLAGKFQTLSREEYLDLLISCLEHLSPDLVIHRVTGDGPKDLLIAPLWSSAKRSVLNDLHHLMKVRNTWQGRLYKEDLYD